MSVINSATSAVAQKVSNLRKSPDSVTIADLFHRKLYNYVDFDYVLDYLRSNGIASCDNIYTIKSISHELLPKITELALTERNAKKANKAYVGVLRLCKRRRKNLLAYLTLEGNATVCKINSWNTFCQYARFANNASADSLRFDTEKVFPTLKINRSLRARTADETPVTDISQEVEVVTEDLAVAMNTNTTKKQQRTNDASFDVTFTDADLNQNTGLFGKGSATTNAQLMAMHYASVVDGTAKVNDKYLCDMVLYYIVYRNFPNYRRLTTLKDYYNKLMQLFTSVGVTLSLDFIASLDKDLMRDFKNVSGIEEHEFNSEANEIFTQALMSLVEKSFIVKVSPESSLSEIFTAELSMVKDIQTKWSSRIKNAQSLIDITVTDNINKIIPDYQQIVQQHNTTVFPKIYAAIATRTIQTSDIVYGFDTVAYLLVADVLHITNMSLSDFPDNFKNTIHTLLPNLDFDWNDVAKHTSEDVLLTYRVATGIVSQDNQYSGSMIQILRQAIGIHYQLPNANTASWQQLFLSMTNTNRNTSSISTTSAAEALGIQNTDLDTDLDI